MAEAQLRLQIESLHAEVANLKVKVNSSVATPMAAKDLSLVSFIPKWAGTKKSSVNEFFEIIDSTANIGKWNEKDKIQITVLRLTDTAKTFYSGCLELHAPDITWENFKAQFLKRFKDARNDQYHFLQLQTARQKTNETPLEFADRCRFLAQRTVKKVDDPIVQKCHAEQADRMLLAAFLSGLIGNPGQQVKFKMPQTLEEALHIATTVYEAEIQEKRNEMFYTAVAKRCEKCNRYGHASQQCRAKMQFRDKEYKAHDSKRSHWGQKQNKSYADRSRNGYASAQRSYNSAAVKCYECNKLGHFARECYRRRQNSQPRRKNDEEKANRQDSRYPNLSNNEDTKSKTLQGN
jgi:hypothetical protein